MTIEGEPGTARPCNPDGRSGYYFLFGENDDFTYERCPDGLRAYAGSIPDTVECDTAYRDERGGQPGPSTIVVGRPLDEH